MFRAILTGNLGKDCVIREGQNGTKFASFSVATRDFDKGEEVTQWVECTWFNPRENFASTLKKGSYVYVEGRIKTGHEVSQDGKVYDYRRLTVDVCEYGGGGKTQVDNNTASQAPQSNTKKEETSVPSMYASKSAEKVAEAANPIFDPDPSDSEDLPF